MAATADSYHHGALPEVLMNTALEEIARAGVQNLSLRALARAAGVSATAPYRHFPSKRCLLAALATRGFRQLAARVRAEVDLLAPESTGEVHDLAQHMTAMGLAYVNFAREHPVTYQMMFGGFVDDFSEYESLHEASATAFQQLENLLQAVLDAGGGRGLSLPQLCGAVWSCVHGFANLSLNIRLGEDQELKTASQPQRAVLALQHDPGIALRAMLLPFLEPAP